VDSFCSREPGVVGGVRIRPESSETELFASVT